MSSRTALRRERVAQAVLDGGVGHLSIVAESLAQRLAADGVLQAMETGLQPEVPLESLSDEAAEAVAKMQSLQAQMAPAELPSWISLQQMMMMVLTFYTTQYMVLDDIHQQEAAQDWVPRDARDRAVEAAYKDMVAVRRYVAGVLDERAADSLLGLTGSTATQPVELRRQMQSAIRRLRAPESHVPKPRIEGLEPDWGLAIQQLERGLGTLDGALQELASESAAALQARKRRDAALAAHRDAVTSVRSMLRGLYILAGERDLVDEIRSPFSRRSAGLEPGEEDEDIPFDEPFEEDDEDEPAAEDPSGSEGETGPVTDPSPRNEEVEP